jgi:N-formylglutamate amidohydrolase
LGMTEKIVLNIPHSSALFPFGREAWKGDLDGAIKRLTDWYTDNIFSPTLGDNRIVPVIFPWSRFFCDVERLAADPLEVNGQGIAYTSFADCTREIGEEQRKEILRFWIEHRRRLSDEIDSDGVLLIDCHSFPEDMSDTDICIGLNDDWSEPEAAVVALASVHFMELGYAVSLNSPYSNSITPESPFKYSSMMLEINRRTYLTEDGGIDPRKAARMKEAISKLYEKLLADDAA